MIARTTFSIKILVFITLCSLFGIVNSYADQLSYVRFGQYNDFSRIILDLNKDEPFRISSNQSSNKLLIDFPKIEALPSKTSWPSEQTLVREVRFIAGSSNIQAEIDLRSSGTIHRTFRLESFNRLVIDITGSQKSQANQKTEASTSHRQENKNPTRASTERHYHRQLAKHDPAPDKKSATPPQGADAPRTESARLSSTPSARALLAKAEREWNAGQYELAQESYTTFLRHFPQHNRNHLIAVRLADIRRKQNQPRQALDAYAKVAQDYPRSEGALISQIRMAELRLAHPDLLPESMARLEKRYLPFYAPMPTLQQIVRDYPFHSLSHVARHTIAQMLLGRGELQAAFDIYSDLFHMTIRDPWRQEVEAKFYETLGLILQKHVDQGNYDKALEVFFRTKSKPYSINGMHPDLIVPVSKSYEGLGLVNEAAHLLGLLLKIGQVSPSELQDISVHRARLLFKNGQKSEAKSELEPLEQYSEESARRKAIRLLSEMALQERKPDVSLHYMEMIEPSFSADANQSTIYARIGKGFESEGKPERAAEMYQRCIESSQKDESTYLESAEGCLYRLGKIHRDQDQPEQALSVYQTLLAAFPQTHYRDPTLFALAKIYQDLNDEKSMIKMLTALKNETQDPIWRRISDHYLEEASWQVRFRDYMTRF